MAKGKVSGSGDGESRSFRLREGQQGPTEQRGQQGYINNGQQGTGGAEISLPRGWSSDCSGPTAQSPPPTPPQSPPPPISEG